MNEALENSILNLTSSQLKMVRMKLSQYLEKLQELEKEKGAKRLVAYIRPKPNFNLEDFQMTLGKRMPDHMIPAKFIQVEEFPKLPNGKIDFRKIKTSTQEAVGPRTVIEKPKNKIEEQLVAIWEKVLNFSPIHTTDNFFEIGGDSILSIQIIAKLRECGIDITPNQLFKHQTIAALSAEVKSSLKPTYTYRHLVEIKGTGSKPPLYCLHAGGIHLFSYNRLADYMDSQRPIYALQASAVTGKLKLHKSVEEMAHDFLDEIKINQPKGPYHIMAYCFSTAVGLEIARILEERKEEVNFIVVDTIAHFHQLFAWNRTKTRILNILKVLRDRRVNRFFGLIRKRIKSFIDPKLVKYLGEKEERKIERLRLNYLKIYKKYSWDVYKGKFILLLTESGGRHLVSDIIKSWEKITEKENDIIDIEGKHEELFSDVGVRDTAISLEYCMENFENELDKTFERNLQSNILLTPIQHWFFDTHKRQPHYWNQIVRLTNVGSLDQTNIKSILDFLVFQHDALRLSFSNNTDGWKANLHPKKNVEVFRLVDLSQTEDVLEQNKEIKEVILGVQEKCSLVDGPLFKCLFFKCGELQENKIYLLAHHLVIDSVSWSLLNKNFNTGVKHQFKKKPIVLSGKTLSIKQWGEYLLELSTSPEILKELPFWEMQKEDSYMFPSDYTQRNNHFEECSIKVLKAVISEEETSLMLQGTDWGFSTEIEELLITVLHTVLSEWSNLERICFGLEKHGRNAGILEVDVSNTVGWFTSYFPISINISKTSTLKARLKHVSEQLRSVPNDGIGYGILKYLNQDQRRNSKLRQKPQVIFNYLGISSDNKNGSNVGFKMINKWSRHPNSERSYGLEVNAIIENGQLRMNWSYSTELFKETTVKNLVARYNTVLREILLQC